MSHSLSWRRLLSSNRVSRSGSSTTDKLSGGAGGRKADERTPFEQDYDRIVFSQPFRRMAKKTQVHPMASNDHIHNRLTHSIEVASVGRGFAHRVGVLARQKSDLRDEDVASLPWIMQSACLIHDIGNPPFGHAGEEVVRAWVHEHPEMFERERFDSDASCESCHADWLGFEGNAQGFRISARPDNPKAGYLRLTHATLASAIKYPWLSTDPRAAAKRKHNVYSSETQIFETLVEDLALRDRSGVPCRHPLSFLTEAADDICYRILDLEDAVEMGIREFDKVQDLFLRISGNQENSSMPLSQLRGQAIKNLMDKCWQVFEDDFDTIMNGDRIEDLKSSLDSESEQHLQDISDAYDEIFGHRKKVATELGAYHVVGRILKALFKTVQSIDDAAHYKDVHFLSKRCAELVWGRKYAEENLSRDYAWWLSQVMDFVSGMTDDYATDLSREIGGLALSQR